MMKHLCVAVACGLGYFAVPARVAPAQQPHLSPAALGQVVDEVLNALVPPDRPLSRVPVAERGIVFDVGRTMAAFPEIGTQATNFRDLRVRTPVELGTKDVLDGCTQHLRQNACARLGWRVYTWMSPVSVTSSEIVVRAHVRWAERGGARPERGMAPEGSASLVGFSTDVYLVRTPTGEWRFSKRGNAAVG